MKKLITIFLSIALLAASSTVLYSCNKEDSNQEEDNEKKDKTGDETKKNKKDDSAVADWVEANEDDLLAEFEGAGDVSIDADDDGFTIEIRMEDLDELDDVDDETKDALKDSLEEEFGDISISDFKEEYDDVPEALEYINIDFCNSDGELFVRVTID